MKKVKKLLSSVKDMVLLGNDFLKGIPENMLTKINFSNLIAIVSLSLVVNLHLGNILNIPIMNAQQAKQETYLKYRNAAEAQLFHTLASINNLVKGEDFALVVIDWEKQGNLTENTDLLGKYLFVGAYDDKAVDVRTTKMKNPYVINYSKSASETNIKNHWKDGEVIAEYTKDYVISTGNDVNTMFGNYWFNTYFRYGITALENEDSRKATRFVIMLSKEAYEKLDNHNDINKELKNLKKQYVNATQDI